MAAPQTNTAGALYGRLEALGLALFVYMTAELFPIGALNDLAMGLHVAPATAGLLLTAYADGMRGRATAAVFAGSSLGLIAGAPIVTGLAHELGWRAAALALAGAAGATAVLLRTVLLETPPPPRAVRTHRTFNLGPVLVVCLVTTALVVGHYVSYTYLARRRGC
ncbi:MFS transporter [Nocardia sp. NBC_00881]|uniref:MFS transporter n=1 Tax=Nocardia sp. NBC_00881 TaxID=2975995 RepID=UPI003865E7C7|nr:MFS transporter [Nocardia sp. NBC_00881]